MNAESSSERMGLAVERSRLRWEEEMFSVKPKEPETGITVAISRQAGAGGSLVARVLGERLQWPVYDHELLQKVADEMGLHPDRLKQLDERRVSWLQECLSGLAVSGKEVNQYAYLHRLAETLAALSTRGRCIIVGRGAAQLLPLETTLRVRMVAPLSFRIQSIERRLGMSHEEASHWADRTDQGRRAFIQDNLNKDPDDPGLYDLVLNSWRFSVEECVDLLSTALKVMEHRLVAAAK